jgi:hypothetical protein
MMRKSVTPPRQNAVKRMSAPRLIPGRRPDTGAGEWLASMVRGLDALEFLERSRELAAEAVTAAPARCDRVQADPPAIR